MELVDLVRAEVAGVGDGVCGMEDGGLRLGGTLQRVRAAACLLEGVWGGEDGSIGGEREEVVGAAAGCGDEERAAVRRDGDVLRACGGECEGGAVDWKQCAGAVIDGPCGDAGAWEVEVLLRVVCDVEDVVCGMKRERARGFAGYWLGEWEPVGVAHVEELDLICRGNAGVGCGVCGCGLVGGLSGKQAW